jgi:glycosyltransferase involved in cell wall biosynthesis
MHLKIGLIVPGFSVDEADWAIPALHAFALALAREHDVRVFSLRYPAAGRYVFGDLSHIAGGGGQRFGSASIGVWKNSLRAVAQEHALRPFHLLHAFWADEPGLVAALAGMRLRLPVIVSLGGGELTHLADIDYGTQGSAVRRLIIRFSLGRANLVSAGSRYQAGLARAKGASSEKLKVIPFGVDTVVFAPGTPPDWRRPSLLQAASLTPVKDQQLLLRIVARVKVTIPEIRLLLAGDGPQRQSLRLLAEELELVDNIDLSGTVAHPEMPGYYSQGHLYVQTSRHESQGMSVLEAMACGLPAVGTPVGVMPEVACEPASWSEEKLAAQIVRLLADEPAFGALRRQARATVENTYSLAGSLENFLSAYRSLSGIG